MEFHWWYIIVGGMALIVFLGKSKGGIVVKRFSANLEILDERFRGCRPEADYSIFKQGEPDHIDIEIDNLPLHKGEELEFYINGNTLAKAVVKRNNEAEFDHWGDENVDFPVIKEGDELIVKYQNKDVLKGVFLSS